MAIRATIDDERFGLMPTPDEVAATLRRRAFDTQLKTAPRSAGDRPQSFGLIHEFWQRDTLVTLTAFKTGDLSLYFSNGGGIIGSVGHERFANLVRKTMPLLGPLTSQLERCDDTEPPRPGEITFTILTDQGRFRSIVTAMPERKKENANFQLLALSQGLITELRKASEARGDSAA
jgi:hypothetical protein